MKKTSKRILGIALAALLIAVALVGAGAAATEFEPAEGGYASSTDLCTSLNNAASGTAELTTTSTTNDTVKLLNDVTLKTRNLKITGTVILDLNGHVLEGDNTVTASVIKVSSGGTLNLYDCGTTTHHFKDSTSTTGLWEWDSTEQAMNHTVTGGCITGGLDNGVIVEGSFTMNGGNIVGNKSGSNGGGVKVWGG